MTRWHFATGSVNAKENHTDFRPRLNGNLRAFVARSRIGSGGTTKCILHDVRMLPISNFRKSSVRSSHQFRVPMAMSSRHRSGALFTVALACTICMVMCRNGAVTGLIPFTIRLHLKRIPPAPRQGQSESSAAEASPAHTTTRVVIAGTKKSPM